MISVMLSDGRSIQIRMAASSSARRKASSSVAWILDIHPSYHRVDPRLFESDKWLGMDLGEDQMSSPALHPFCCLFERVQAGCIDRVNIPHAQNTHSRRILDHLHRLLELVCGTEEERTVDLVDLDAGNGCGARQRLVVIGCIVAELPREAADVGDDRHPAHEQEHRDHKADLDRHRKIGKHRQQERRHEHNDIASGAAEHRTKRPPLAHVVGDDNEYGSQTGKWDQRCPLPQEDHHEQQCDRMDDTGDRSPTTISDVGDGACDRSGGGNATEQRGDDVGDPLGDQLGIGAMPAPDHSVGNYSRQKRLDGAKHGDRESRTEHCAHGLEADRRYRWRGYRRWNAAEAGADRLDIEMQKMDRQSCTDEGDKSPRNAAGDTWPEHDRQKRSSRNPHGLEAGCAKRMRVRLPLLYELRRHFSHPQTEEVLDL
jgi:hypothetical protein